MKKTQQRALEAIRRERVVHGTMGVASDAGGVRVAYSTWRALARLGYVEIKDNGLSEWTTRASYGWKKHVARNYIVELVE